MHHTGPHGISRFTGSYIQIHIICSLPLATMCGVFLSLLLIGLKGQHLIRVILLLVLLWAGEACHYFPCCHVGGVLCHISQGHTPRPTAHVLILVHRVGEGTVGPAQQAVNTALLRSTPPQCTKCTTATVTQQLTVVMCMEWCGVVLAHTYTLTTSCMLLPLLSPRQQ